MRQPEPSGEVPENVRVVVEELAQLAVFQRGVEPLAGAAHRPLVQLESNGVGLKSGL